MKRIIVLTVVLCMMMSFGVFANDTAGLEAAVMRVKTITEVPEWLNEFNYRLSKNEDRSIWYLNWNDENYEIGSLSATIADSGDVLSFRRYDYKADKSGEPVDISEAIKTAELYAKTILGDDYAKMRITNRETIPQDSNSETFIIKFGRYENDIPVFGQTCSVGVNKFTSVCESYSGFIFDRETEFALPEKIISREDAISAFVEEIGIKLQYRSNYNYKDNELTVYPAYFLSSDNSVIDAVTGEKIVIETNDNYYMADMAMSTAENATAGGVARLSPQEQKAVDELGNMISEEKATEIVKEKIKEFADASLSETYLSKNGREKYVMNLQFDQEEKYYGSASLDAKTGEIISFNFSTYTFENFNGVVKDEEIKVKVENMAKLLSGDKYSQVKDESEEGIFRYVRQVNGIEVVGDGIRISYDDEKNVINSYSLNWTDIESFPDISNVMSELETANAIADRLGYELFYMQDKLVYSFVNKDYSIFSAYTGNPLKYNGKEYEFKKTPEYKDIEGHWCENTVKKLLENNIGMVGETFRPDDTITQKEFVEYVYYSYGFEDDEAIEEYIKEHELFADVKLDGEVTRNDAAKIFATRLGYSEIAQDSEMFVKPFADCDDEYKGYVAICKKFDILSGDGNGNFRGNDSVTRAESAVLLYNYMYRR